MITRLIQDPHKRLCHEVLMTTGSTLHLSHLHHPPPQHPPQRLARRGQGMPWAETIQL
jgi:hypothetical protein